MLPAWYGDEANYPRLNLLLSALFDGLTIVSFATMARAIPWLLVLVEMIPVPGSNGVARHDSVSVGLLLMIVDLTVSLAIVSVALASVVKLVRLQIKEAKK